jgi:putative ABC transport system substrate-binding protein
VLVVPAGSMFFALGDSMVKSGTALKVPVIYPFEEWVEAGGLMSYAISLPETYRRAAAYVDRILRGAKPGDLPIEQPTRLSLAVNLKTAQQLGITIPAAVLARADRVIE